MGTIVDKLTYLANTKEEIRKAIISKGMECSTDDTFHSYADKIREIEAGKKIPRDYVGDIHDKIFDYRDCLNVSDSCFDLTENITAEVVRKTFEESVYNYALFKSIDSAGDYDTKSFAIASKLGANFNWYYNNSQLTNIYYHGNSWVGLNASSEHIKVNRRDTYNDICRIGVVSDPVRNLKALKFVWSGWSPFSMRNDTTKYHWGVYFIENGDLAICLEQKGASATWDGSFSMLGADFSLSNAGDWYSFYRQNTAGTSWTAEAGTYNKSKSLNLF